MSIFKKIKNKVDSATSKVDSTVTEITKESVIDLMSQERNQTRSQVIDDINNPNNIATRTEFSNRVQDGKKAIYLTGAAVGVAYTGDKIAKGLSNDKKDES